MVIRHTQTTPDTVPTPNLPDHTHECRDCGGTVECGYDSATCDRIGGWAGGNDGCDCTDTDTCICGEKIHKNYDGINDEMVWVHSENGYIDGPDGHNAEPKA